ncbi:hypothetical protein PQX77_012358 [Marasmius sp. AFHP31]|nr:hypothetical protein PQX77_012358 [Marasmius sp. AFHP31]
MLVSKAQPSLLQRGFAAFSHDDDWISVLEGVDDDSALLEGTELLEHICQKFKFVAEGDVVYTESLTPKS